MVVTKQPKKNVVARIEKEADAFISKADKEVDNDGMTRKPIQLRLRESMLKDVDRAARQRGVTRAAFITWSISKELESMGI
jgi:uncharacterized protein (DUF1778 family)